MWPISSTNKMRDNHGCHECHEIRKCGMRRGDPDGSNFFLFFSRLCPRPYYLASVFQILSFLHFSSLPCRNLSVSVTHIPTT
ncbi:hypothetical protein BDV25DRAFT_32267 [Aspergillus avenaceus]|uniref:Uncharacterized protein n=1 Tax=Aspergillus avenaceus TaxID=36643 RepID=A0A5N6TMF2_ASPAV|nr:hypothetical protein BDV25DRAFT_32267 [Aspergillus avenaceus]